jgi:hypothetical protein
MVNRPKKLPDEFHPAPRSLWCIFEHEDELTRSLKRLDVIYKYGGEYKLELSCPAFAIMSTGDESVSVRFPAGPLGITFEWKGGLKISDIEKEEKVSEEVLGNLSLQQHRDTKETILALRRGDILSSVNGIDVQHLPFGEVVALLRAAEKSERLLQFSKSGRVDIQAAPARKPPGGKPSKKNGNKEDRGGKGDKGDAKVARRKRKGEKEIGSPVSADEMSRAAGSLEGRPGLALASSLEEASVFTTDQTVSNGPDSPSGRGDPNSDSSVFVPVGSESQTLLGEAGRAPARPEGGPRLEVMAPIHAGMLAALRASATLRPLEVRVVNESYWYAQRKKLGGRKHQALPVKQNKHNCLWESAVFKLKIQEDDGEWAPQRVFCSTHRSKWAAVRHSSMAARERDLNPALVSAAAAAADPDNKGAGQSSMRPEDVLATHFRLQVVSATFDRMTSAERVEMVYTVLLEALGQSCLPQSQADAVVGRLAHGLGRVAPSGARLASHYGSNVCALPIFRFILPEQPLTLLIEAKTPSQWKPALYPAPDSERYGRDHAYMSSLNVSRAVKAPASNKRLTQLASLHAVGSGGASSVMSLKAGSHKDGDGGMSAAGLGSLAETLGVAGMDYGGKQGGLYGHFFQDLQPDIKQAIMERFQANKTLIQKEGALPPEPPAGKKKKKEDSFKPKTTLSVLRKKAGLAKVQAEYDKGTQNEEEMLEVVSIHNFLVEQAAIRLQRMWRCKLVAPVARRLWRRQYSALLIQKAVRAHFGRIYAGIFRRVRPFAVVRIQRCYRAMKSRIVRKVWRQLVFHITRRVLPKMKRFLANCYKSWLVRHNACAVKIQSAVRIHLARVRCWFKRGLNYITVEPHRAAIRLQRAFRGRQGRLRYDRLFEEMLFYKVEWPAAIMLQRIYRGKLSREVAAQKRLEKRCAQVLQRSIRAFVQRLWLARHRRVRLEEQSATCIQRRVRGIIDRTVYKFL